MLENNIIKKWIDSFDQNQDEYKQKNEEYLQLFLEFSKKTPQQIIDEKEALSKKEFKKTYSNYFNSFIDHLKNKKMEPNLIREITGTVKLFFKYAKLPLNLGVRGHLQLFLKDYLY